MVEKSTLVQSGERVGLNSNASGFYSEVFSSALRRAQHMKAVRKSRELNALFLS